VQLLGKPGLIVAGFYERSPKRSTKSCFLLLRHADTIEQGKRKRVNDAQAMLSEPQPICSSLSMPLGRTGGQPSGKRACSPTMARMRPSFLVDPQVMC
jgi:hypothetical protein